MTVSYLFSGLLGHLPVLAALIAGLVLVSARQTRLGPRSTTLARLGLAALLLSQLLNMAWLFVFPQLIRSLDYRASTYGMVTFGVSVVLSLLMAAGLGLLIAALVTRGAGGGGPFDGSPYGFQEAARAGAPAVGPDQGSGGAASGYNPTGPPGGV
ncbi:hypothetical protein AB0J80_30380 [Actinoplanes sp. NPDC049548]|uniref:hypothetical protein n=1 Tax=Actinoplanes sp. NPDC049548 TaxID=3155152 RepID=UPI00341BC5EE